MLLNLRKLVSQISQICATAEENRIALYLFFLVDSSPLGNIPPGFFCFSDLYGLFFRKITYENEKNSVNL